MTVCAFFGFSQLGGLGSQVGQITIALTFLGPAYIAGQRSYIVLFRRLLCIRARSPHGKDERTLGGLAARTLDLRSKARGFDSRSGRYQVVTARTGDCLWTGEPSPYITNHQGQLSLLYLRGR